MKTLFKSGLAVAASFILLSCNEQKKTASQETSVQTESHEGHDHSSHSDKIEASIKNDPSVVATPEAVNPETAPQFNFQEGLYDFGTINSGDEVEHLFKFTNTGKEPLVIQNVSTSCGCTVPEYSKEPIAPGSEGSILVKYNSKNKRGIQQKSITITANTNPKITTLKIKGEVLAAPDLNNGPVKQ